MGDATCAGAAALLPFQPRMTLRVSRDGGRTWGRTRVIAPTAEPAPADENLALYPPCKCPRHRRAGGRAG